MFIDTTRYNGSMIAALKALIAARGRGWFSDASHVRWTDTSTPNGGYHSIYVGSTDFDYWIGLVLDYYSEPCFYRFSNGSLQRGTWSITWTSV